MDFSRCTNVELEPRPGTRSPFDRGSSSQASSESPRGFSPDIEELERFIDSYVQEYRVEGRLNDAPNDADSERSPPPISQEEWPTDSGTWDANYVKKVCDSPWTPQDVSDSNWGTPPAQNEKPPRRSPPGLSNHGDCQKKQVPRDPSYDIWAANTNPYESSWSWCQQNDTPTVPSSILSQWDGPHDMNMRSSWQSPGIESSSTNNAKNCAPQKAVEISLYPCDGEDQKVKGESPSCRSEKSYQRPYRPPACRTAEATVAPHVDRRDNWQRPHGRRGSVGRTGGPQPQGHRIQPHSIQFWGLPQPDRSSSGWQGKRLGGRYTNRGDTGSWRAGGDSERARPDGEQTPPRERHGQHSRHQPNNSMPHMTKSSPLCSSSLDDESINPPGSSSNKVQVQMPTERCTPRGCDQDGCTGVLLPAGEKSARRQPQAPVLLESSRAHLRSRFRGQLNQVESRSDPDSDRGAMQHVEDMLSQLKGCTPLSDSSVAAFLEVVSRVVTSKAQMEELVKSMLEHGMIDRAFAHSMARLCRELSGMVTSDGTRFRKLLLDQLQTEYGKRDVTQHSNVERWLGFVTLLSEVFGAMRSSDGEPFHVLILPIYTCLQELLQAQEKGEDAVLCCCLELQSIGSLLESCSPSGMTDLLSIVRDKMLDPDASLLTCSLLLEIVEVHANSWLPLTAPTATYYNRTLQKLAA